MTMEKISKAAFTVIGKEGSTREGAGFIQRLWTEANGHFDEVSALAKRDEQGQLAGVWGAMSDEGRTMSPWEDNFTRGLYLAGVECVDDAEAPDGWTRWRIPGFDYLRVKNEGGDTFQKALAQLSREGYALAGAVQDFTDPATGEGYMYFPVGRKA